MKKLTLLFGLGVGYVLGARAGRSRYEELARRFEELKGSPRVQEAASKVTEAAASAAPVVKEKVAATTSEVVDKASAKVSAAKKSSAKPAEKKESDKAEGSQSLASGAPSSGAAPEGVLDPLAGPKGDLP